MGYVTVAEAQAQGHTADPADLQAAIDEASSKIDELTGWWFEPRALAFTLDGNDGLTLPVHVPIIAIDTVHLDGELVEEASYVVYNRHMSEDTIVPEDDRNFPRLERRWRSDAGLVEDLYYRAGRGVWPAGQRNLEIAGTFGYTDPPGPLGVTPPAIKRACFLLINTLLIPLGPSGADELEEQANNARLKRLRTRDQEVEYFQGTGGSTGNPTGYLTGDPRVDSILARYMSPPSMGVAKCRFVAA